MGGGAILKRNVRVSGVAVVVGDLICCGCCCVMSFVVGMRVVGVLSVLVVVGVVVMVGVVLEFISSIVRGATGVVVVAGVVVSWGGITVVGLAAALIVGLSGGCAVGV